jgi:hypothetical protein
MNPGAIEEGAKVAGGFIEALKGQPAVLALSVANMALLVFIFYALHLSAKYRETLVSQVLANSQSINDIVRSRSVACPNPAP